MCIFIDPARICIINDLINIIPVHGGAFLSNNEGISLETDGEQHTKCRRQNNCGKNDLNSS